MRISRGVCMCQIDRLCYCNGEVQQTSSFHFASNTRMHSLISWKSNCLLFHKVALKIDCLKTTTATCIPHLGICLNLRMWTLFLPKIEQCWPNFVLFFSLITYISSHPTPRRAWGCVYYVSTLIQYFMIMISCNIYFAARRLLLPARWLRRNDSMYNAVIACAGLKTFLTW